MARRASSFFKILISIVGIIIGVILLIFIIGIICDKSTESSIQKAGDESLEYLGSLKRNEDGNAWDFYSIAIEKSRDIKSDRTLSQYLEGDKEIIAEILEVISNNQEVIDNIREGARQDYYSYSYNYEEGVAIVFPDFLVLRRAVDITCIKALYDLENGRNEIALDGIFSVIIVGNHIASGAPVLLDQMIGSVIADKALKIVEIGISSSTFNDRQTEDISEFLNDMDRHWPLFSTAMDGETKLLKISFAKLQKDFESLFSGWWDNIEITFLRKLAVRAFCWKYFFSPKRATQCSIKFMDGIISQIDEIERKTLSLVNEDEIDRKAEYEIEKQMKNYARKNPIFRIIIPNLLQMYHRKLQIITRIRMLQIANSITSHRFKKGKFPHSIEEIATELIVDFNTGKAWEFTNYGDSVTLFSPGPNISDKKDDISITLTKMGIKKYLEKKWKEK